MKRPLQALLLLLSGLGLLHATLLTDLYLRYVKEGMRPVLIASGAVLLVLAAAEAWSCWNPKPESDDTHSDDGGHGHDHSTPPHVAWLLFLPALSLLVYAPPAIGAYTASREAPKVVAVTDQDDFEPLPKTSPLPMTLTDFTKRVQQDREQAIEGREIQLTGYATPDDQSGDGWYLTRTIFSCCAADAQFVKVRVHGTPPPPADTWVTLTGTWHPTGTLGTNSAEAALDVHAIKEVPRPTNGYKDALPLPGS
ncbi:TIGR03943 family putative permease subunit [Streptomyces capitiformicae]|uniref:Membrane protein n=1 Tax=Streptomyces capitiformicae TaxID=2014920 RepID=A0A919GFY5_9ACTN|nr:TIGR03943 family protein [Streptomyces capitiformicae]GHH83945.1 membrane protein [Streptomyces capitiformicae]